MPPNKRCCLFPIQHVDNFLLQVSHSPLAASLFQLAICGGSLAAPPDLAPKDKASKTSEQAKTEDQPTKSLPSEGIHAGSVFCASHADSCDELTNTTDKCFLLRVSQPS